MHSAAVWVPHILAVTSPSLLPRGDRRHVTGVLENHVRHGPRTQLQILGREYGQGLERWKQSRSPDLGLPLATHTHFRAFIVEIPECNLHHEKHLKSKSNFVRPLVFDI